MKKKDYSKVKKNFCLKNKYLKKIGLKQKDYDFYYDIKSSDKRWEQWEKERKKYGGVCSMDTWDLGLSIMPITLYTQLKMFMEYSIEAMEQSQIEYYDIAFKQTKEGKWERQVVKVSKNKKEYLEYIISLLEEYIIYFYKINGEHLLEWIKEDEKDNEAYMRLYKEENIYYSKLQLAIKMLSKVVLGLWW